MQKSNIVYVAMAADLIHSAHVKILQIAASYGPVIVGLLTDEAITSYKRKPIISWEQRRDLISHFKGVVAVVPQRTHDYAPNLDVLRPAFLVHGSDWKVGTQKHVRERVVRALEEWGGVLVEPDYTENISTTQIIERCKESHADHLISLKHTTPAPNTLRNF